MCDIQVYIYQYIIVEMHSVLKCTHIHTHKNGNMNPLSLSYLLAALALMINFPSPSVNECLL